MWLQILALIFWVKMLYNQAWPYFHNLWISKNFALTCWLDGKNNSFVLLFFRRIVDWESLELILCYLDHFISQFWFLLSFALHWIKQFMNESYIDSKGVTTKRSKMWVWVWKIIATIFFLYKSPHEYNAVYLICLFRVGDQGDFAFICQQISLELVF